MLLFFFRIGVRVSRSRRPASLAIIMLNKGRIGMTHQERLDQLCINTIRMLAADAVQKAKSGHPGMPMGAAAMAYVLWTRFLKHNPANPKWPDRDRFVLGARP